MAEETKSLIDPPVDEFSSEEDIKKWIVELEGRDATDSAVQVSLIEARELLELIQREARA